MAGHRPVAPDGGKGIKVIGRVSAQGEASRVQYRNAQVPAFILASMAPIAA